MRVTVNGEQREIQSGSVDALLGELEYEGTHFAIALNYDVLPRAKWAETPLKSGDEIEIITPRQGGGGECRLAATNSAVILRCEPHLGEPRRMAARTLLPSFEARKSAHLRMTASLVAGRGHRPLAELLRQALPLPLADRQRAVSLAGDHAGGDPRFRRRDRNRGVAA